MNSEKAVKGLEVCFDSSKECNGCPYITTPYCKTTLRNDVIAMLKEQEEYIEYWSAKYDEYGKAYMKVRDERDSLLKEQDTETGHWIYKKHDDMFMCSCCEKYSIRNDYPYCHWCGAKMEGRENE